jgi:hypothetical protein
LDERESESNEIEASACIANVVACFREEECGAVLFVGGARIHSKSLLDSWLQIRHSALRCDFLV